MKHGKFLQNSRVLLDRISEQSATSDNSTPTFCNNNRRNQPPQLALILRLEPSRGIADVSKHARAGTIVAAMCGRNIGIRKDFSDLPLVRSDGVYRVAESGLVELDMEHLQVKCIESEKPKTNSSSQG